MRYEEQDENFDLSEEVVQYHCCLNAFDEIVGRYFSDEDKSKLNSEFLKLANEKRKQRKEWESNADTDIKLWSYLYNQGVRDEGLKTANNRVKELRQFFGGEEINRRLKAELAEARHDD